MKLAAKIVLSIFALGAVWLYAAYLVMDTPWRDRATRTAEGKSEELAEAEKPVDLLEEARRGVVLAAFDEQHFTDSILGRDDFEGGLLLAEGLREMSSDQLERHFVELMARDLEDRRSLDYAGRVLREIASREPELGVGLLGALTPAEKVEMASFVVEGWTGEDPEAAFGWARSAWLGPDGGFIDRDLQNRLTAVAVDTLVLEQEDYAKAATFLQELVDPQLRAELTGLVAQRIVGDGPERALDRLAMMEDGFFDSPILDAVAEQWAARDGEGAASWVLANEGDMSDLGVRNVARELTLASQEAALGDLYEGLVSVSKRYSVAAEAARLMARRDPAGSADWARAIGEPIARREAVFNALAEIGYESFSSSVDYIDYVYEAADAERMPVVFTTLKDWLSVDGEAVAGYLGSGRANLSADLSDELLEALVASPNG
ncbi:hypothetical protein [Pelagicoccus albus]|uniref:Uncharacterized protein n=1 Tax=Pelagicoccus albus TaxID=415222 RepID=A0A7X1B7K8_9BACT|nr:hypothetical protein [Pelagicoccus albus]MBC2607133.1 hypothetical protein [Pelagicoccus albus]